MGTRGLLVVACGGQYRMANLCPWDSHPSRLGVGALRFARWVPRAVAVAAFNACTWLSDEEADALIKENNYTTHPSLRSDVSYMALFHVVLEGGEALHNALHFVGQSLHNEWTYVLDYDNNRFEVYEGGNLKHLGPSHRFPSAVYGLADGDCYHPVSLVWWCPLDQLPTDDEFMEAIPDNLCIKPMKLPKGKTPFTPRQRTRIMG